MKHIETIRDARSKEQTGGIVYAVFSGLSRLGRYRLPVTKPRGSAELKN